MQKLGLWVALGVGLALIGISGYLFLGGDDEAATRPEPLRVPAPSAPQEEPPPIRHPIPPPEPEPQAPPPEPLPPLDESDPALRDAVQEALGEEGEAKLGLASGIVRRLVVTIDNLPRKKLAPKVRPVGPVAGSFVVQGNDQSLVLSTENYARYTPIVTLIEGLPAAQLEALYRKYYPLFQEAYEELGYPDAYFNDRMVDVIDHLLATPEVTGPIRLVQPNVFYEFADPELEALSAGQKLMLRIGPENAAVVRTKLRELRNAIAAGDDTAESPDAS